MTHSLSWAEKRKRAACESPGGMNQLSTGAFRALRLERWEGIAVAGHAGRHLKERSSLGLFQGQKLFRSIGIKDEAEDEDQDEDSC